MKNVQPQMDDAETPIQHCGHETPEELLVTHPCPYLEDIYGDMTTLCTCCHSCQQQCALDV